MDRRNETRSDWGYWRMVFMLAAMIVLMCGMGVGSRRLVDLVPFCAGISAGAGLTLPGMIWLILWKFKP